MRAEIALDDGARRFGEVALVDDSSRVGETGIVFHNTLFDENAASHIAWGRGLPWAVDGLDGDPEALGVNNSLTHIDFMVGCAGGARSTGSSPAARPCRCCARGAGRSALEVAPGRSRS